MAFQSPWPSQKSPLLSPLNKQQEKLKHEIINIHVISISFNSSFKIFCTALLVGFDDSASNVLPFSHSKLKFGSIGIVPRNGTCESSDKDLPPPDEKIFVHS